jgi:hypothetical protein
MSSRFTKITLIAVMALTLAACKDDEKEASGTGEGTTEPSEVGVAAQDATPENAETVMDNAVETAVAAVKGGAETVGNVVSDVVDNAVEAMNGGAEEVVEAAHSGADTASGSAKEAAAATGAMVAGAVEKAAAAAGVAKESAAGGFLRLKQGLKQSLSSPDTQ